MDVDALSKLDGDACGGRLKVAGALALWIVGRLLISFALRLLGRTFKAAIRRQLRPPYRPR